MFKSTFCTALFLSCTLASASDPYEKMGNAIRTPLAPGVDHIHIRTKAPLSVHVIEIEPKSTKAQLEAVLALDRLGEEETVKAMTTREKAIVGINASFPAGKGFHPGMIVIDGELISSPSHRSAFGMKRDGTPVVGMWTDTSTWKAKIIAADSAMRELAPMNAQCGPDEITLYSAAYGNISPGGPKQSVTEVLLDEYRRPVEVRTGGEGFPLSGGSLVLSGRDLGSTWLQEHCKPGEKVTLDLRTEPPWQELQFAIAAGPRLLNSGTFIADPEKGYPDGEDFETSHKKQYDKQISRAAAGLTRAKDKILLVVVDGEQPKFSTGLTLKGMAELMRELEASDAVQLGYGGDTTLVINGNVVNEPTYKMKNGIGAEKEVPGALVVKVKK